MNTIINETYKQDLQQQLQLQTQSESDQDSSQSQANYYVLQFKGPIKDSWKQAVQTYGAQFYSYIPEYSFIVKLPDANLEKIKNLQFVETILPYNPEFKINTETVLHAEADENNQLTLDLYLFDSQNINEIKQQF